MRVPNCVAAAVVLCAALTGCVIITSAKAAPVNAPWFFVMEIRAPDGRVGVAESPDNFPTAEACGEAMSSVAVKLEADGFSPLRGVCVVDGVIG